jgi:hypothetical protein
MDVQKKIVKFTTIQNLLRNVFKMALEAGGPVARLSYSRQAAGPTTAKAGIVK